MNPSKDPVLAAILSGLIPGLGQIYCRRWGRGALFFLGAMLVGSFFPPFSLLLGMGVWVWGIADAYRLAGDRQDRAPAGSGRVIDIGKARFPGLDRRHALTFAVIPLCVVALLAAVIFLLLARYGLWDNRGAGADVKPLIAMIEAYKKRTGSYPDTLTTLVDPTDPLEKKQIVDAWGRPYVYRPGAGGFELESAGKDGRPGTKDDIPYHP